MALSFTYAGLILHYISCLLRFVHFLIPSVDIYIDCRGHESSGVSREKEEEYERVLPPHKSVRVEVGSGSLSRETF